MNKNTKKILYIIGFSIIVITIFCITKQYISKKTSNQVVVNQHENFYKKFKHISSTNTFNQKENEYIVYFYMQNCSDCNKVFNNFKNYTSNKNNLSVYLVDMNSTENTNTWYDWKAHNSKYNVEIGKVKEDGTIEYKNGQDLNKYLNNTMKNKFGEPMNL